MNYFFVFFKGELNMNLLERLVKQEQGNLVNNLRGWVTYRQAGDYNAWNNYQPSPDQWNQEDEAKVVLFLLKQLSGESVYPIDLIKIKKQLEVDKQDSMSFRFFQILHLYTVLDILDKQTNLYDDDEESNALEQLQSLNIEYLINSAVPGPCIAYLGALRASSEDNLTKISEISCLIVDLTSKKNQFGVLGHLALRIAVQDLEALARVLEASDSRLKKKLSGVLEKSKVAIEECFSLEEIVVGLTFLDTMVLKCLEKLNYEIGEINFSDWKTTLSKVKGEPVGRLDVDIDNNMVLPSDNVLAHRNVGFFDNHEANLTTDSSSYKTSGSDLDIRETSGADICGITVPKSVTY